MKKQFTKISVCYFVFLLAVNTSVAQEKFNVTAGMGLPEMLELGLRVQFQQTQVGLSAGKALGSPDRNFTQSGDLYYHFGGRSEFTKLRPWFFKTGLTYLEHEDEWEKRTYLLLIPRAGRNSIFPVSLG